MCKFILFLSFCFYFSTAFAENWQRAYPCIGDEEPVYERQDLAFRESYVEYRLVDLSESCDLGGEEDSVKENTAQEMQINILDQIERTGFLHERLWNRWMGPLTPEPVLIGEKVLSRVLTLVAGCVLNPSHTKKYNYWPVLPNFELVDEMLEGNRSEIAKAFRKTYPGVTSIYFWQGNPEYRLNRNSNISSIHLAEDSDINAWRAAFNAVGVTLN